MPCRFPAVDSTDLETKPQALLPNWAQRTDRQSNLTFPPIASIRCGLPPLLARSERPQSPHTVGSQRRRRL